IVLSIHSIGLAEILRFFIERLNDSMPPSKPHRLHANTRREQMATLLQIKSSIFSDGGQSSRLADRYVAAWRAANPGGKVIVRDLSTQPVPHLDAARFGAFLSKQDERSAEQQAVLDYADALVEELRAADVI